MTPAGLLRAGLERPYFVPGLLAAASGGGLVAALVFDGVWDLVAWIAVGLPLAAIGWARFVARR